MSSAARRQQVEASTTQPRGGWSTPHCLLAEALEAAGADLLEIGLAYVRFAVSHPAHFEVMFSPALYHAGSAEIAAWRARTEQALSTGVRSVPGGRRSQVNARLAAWSLVHGFATLWLSGSLPPGLGDDAAVAARPVIRLLFKRG